MSQVDQTSSKQWGTEHIRDKGSSKTHISLGPSCHCLPMATQSIQGADGRSLLSQGNVSHDPPPFLSFLHPLVPDGYGTASPLVAATFLAQQDTGWEEAKSPPAHVTEMSTNAFEGTVPASSVPCALHQGHALRKDNGVSGEIWRKGSLGVHQGN